MWRQTKWQVLVSTGVDTCSKKGSDQGPSLDPKTLPFSGPPECGMTVWLFVCCDMQLAPGMTCVILHAIKTCPSSYAAHKSQQAVRAIFGTQSRAPRSQCREDLKSQPSPQPQKKTRLLPSKESPKKRRIFWQASLKNAKFVPKFVPKSGPKNAPIFGTPFASLKKITIGSENRDPFLGPKLDPKLVPEICSFLILFGNKIGP